MKAGNKQSALLLGHVPSVRHYYVDESGDPVLFDARGNVIVGKSGCSRYFFMGLLSVFSPASLESDLKALHKSLLADPYFKAKPSFLERNRKTFFAFHAKDDLPEVREQVFNLLAKHQFKFFAVIKDKVAALSYVLQQNQANPSFRYDENALYDHLVYRLFETRVVANREHNVYFASRGPTDRTQALKNALLSIQERFRLAHKDTPMGKINIFPPAISKRCVNLQAVDYCLWALQRFYVRKEEKYLQMLWPSVSMIHEMDSSTDHKKRGVIYAKEKHPFKGA
jgi:hypothetical protein